MADAETSYEGDEKGLDLSWQSDLKDRKVKSTTEYATPPDEQQGDVSFDFLPGDVDVEDLSESEREILATAAMRDPGSVKALGEMVDWSRSWCAATLQDYAPEMYEDIKMSKSESGLRSGEVRRENADAGTADDGEGEPQELDDEPTNAVDETFVPTDEHQLQRRVDEAAATAAAIERIHEGDVAGRVARELREILEGEVQR